jgi:NTP pyrophosphatase (non-canonical NTP hydrolase)
MTTSLLGDNIKQLSRAEMPDDYELQDALFLDYIKHEVRRARKKFPSSECSLAALMEEVGELAKALLDRRMCRTLMRGEISAEAVQVAVMAMRIAIEGDVTIEPAFTVFTADEVEQTNAARP